MATFTVPINATGSIAKELVPALGEGIRARVLSIHARVPPEGTGYEGSTPPVLSSWLGLSAGPLAPGSTVIAGKCMEFKAGEDIKTIPGPWVGEPNTPVCIFGNGGVAGWAVVEAETAP